MSHGRYRFLARVKMVPYQEKGMSGRRHLFRVMLTANDIQTFFLAQV